jgi:hypothetical protein
MCQIAGLKWWFLIMKYVYHVVFRQLTALMRYDKSNRPNMSDSLRKSPL